MGEHVAVMRAERYDLTKITQQISDALELLGMSLPDGQRVLLKPNVIAQNHPGQCTTTHPVLVAAVCQLLRERRNRIMIGDSSAFYQGGHTWRGFKTSGLARVADTYGCRLVAFEQAPVKAWREPRQVVPELLLTAVLDEVDWVINLPKLKTHSFFEMSGAIKNLFGLVPGSAKYEYHFIGGSGREAFGHKLADIWQIAHPCLTIMDAIWGLEGFGPAATGRPKHSGWLLAASNPYALDWVAAALAGLDPAGLDGIKAGLERRYLENPETIACLGDVRPRRPADAPADWQAPAPSVGVPVAALPANPFKRAPVSEEQPRTANLMYRATTVHPAIRHTRCTACGLCLAACPVQAIDWKSPIPPGRQTAAIDLNRCLRCLHCAAACGQKAIRLQGEHWLNLPIRAARKILRI